MASITKLENGKYRAFVYHKGDFDKPIRRSRTFSTRREAAAWAHELEKTLQQKSSMPNTYTLGDAIKRYAEEVSPTKRGKRWELIRLKAFEKDCLPLDKLLAKVTPQDIVAFRDSRAREVANSTVNRELTLLSSVFRIAWLEWGWVEQNPCISVRRLPNPRHRERVLQWWEIKRVLRELNHNPRGSRPHSIIEVVALATLFALRTGMRAGEITGLTWENLYDRHCHLPTTKTGRPRDVPLSNKALKIINRLRGWDAEFVFGLNPQSLSTLFRRYRQRAGLDGFTFHDTRHTAATMIAKKVEVLDLCKIFGWSNPKMAMVYYNPHAESLADLLD